MAYFLRVAINSNHDLAQVIEQVDVFVDEIFPPYYNQWRLYVNYVKLNEFLEDKLAKEEREVRVSVGIALFSLLAFAENILLIMESVLPNGITDRNKIHAVRFLLEFLQREIVPIRYILRDEMPADEFFFHYANLLDRIENMQEGKVADSKFNLEYFYDLKDFSYASVEQKDLIEINNNDHMWFTELIGRLFLVYGNAYLINANDIQKCWIKWEHSYLLGYQKWIIEEVKENIFDIFENPKMQETWGDMLFEKERSRKRKEENKDIYLIIKNKLLKNYNSINRNENEEGGEGNLKYVEVNRVLELYKDETNNMSGVGWIKNHPELLSEEVRRIGETKFEKINDILRLINNIVAKLEMINHTSLTKAIIKEPNRVAETVWEIKEEYPLHNRKLEEIAYRIRRECARKRRTYLLVDMEVYLDIINVMQDIQIWNSKSNPGFSDRHYRMRQNIKDIMNSLNLTVNVNDDMELQYIVRMGIYVHFIVYLQKMYIFALAQERYSRRNSASSRELETIKVGGKERDTYYYKFFTCACEMLKGIEENVLEEDARETATVIKKAYLQERRNYVKSILPGDKDE